MICRSVLLPTIYLDVVVQSGEESNMEIMRIRKKPVSIERSGFCQQKINVFCFRTVVVTKKRK